MPDLPISSLPVATTGYSDSLMVIVNYNPIASGRTESIPFSAITAAGNYLPLSGGTVTGVTNFTAGLSATTISATTIGSSGDCVDDIYVTNIHSCSPLNINPLDEGNVYYGSTSGVTIDLQNIRFSVGTDTPLATIHVKGKGNTSATNSLLVQNSIGQDYFWVDDAGSTRIRTGTDQRFLFNGGNMFWVDDSGIIRSGSITADLITLNYTKFATSNIGLSSNDSINNRFFNITANATNSTGDEDIVVIDVKPTINHTGTASGDTYGFRYDPTFVSSSGDNYGFVADNNTVKNGFGTLSPSSTLESGGSFGTNIRTQIGSGTVLSTDYTVLVDSSASGTTITLPPISTCPNRIYTVKKISSDTNTIIISGDTNIDGGSSVTFTTQYMGVTLQNDGSQWWSLQSPEISRTFYSTSAVTTDTILTWSYNYYGVNNLSGVTLTLPITSGKTGYYLIIKDEAGTCSVNSITVIPNTLGELIDGQNSVIMNINNMSLTFMVRNGNWYLI